MEDRRRRGEARDRAAREEGDRREHQHVAAMDVRRPTQALGDARLREKMRGRAAPQLRKPFDRHVCADNAARVRDEAEHEESQAETRTPQEPARIALLRLERVAVQFHSPSPLARERAPAKSSSAITSLRITIARTTCRTLAPMRAPSIMPMTDGAAMIGSTAP